MKRLVYYLFHLGLGIVFAPCISGQNGLTEFDTVTVVRPNIKENLYVIADSCTREIQFGSMKTELVPYKTKFRFKDWAFNLGLVHSSSTDVSWKKSSIIKSNDMLPEWMVSLFCEGYTQENRTVVKDLNNGSRSEEYTQLDRYLWEKDAGGILTENSDTIGLFSIRMNPREDTLLKLWTADIFPEQSSQNTGSKVKLSVSWKPVDGADFAITGKFRDKDFTLIRNGSDRKVYIYFMKHLICMFQSDVDFPGIAKKYRIKPYLLINRNIPEINKRDLFRLAIVSRYISMSVDVDSTY
jgi:hypothetical protein